MRLFSLPQLAIGVALVAALTFFFSKAQIDEHELREVEQRLHHFARLDAELNQGLVLVRQGLVKDYDALVSTLGEMNVVLGRLGAAGEGEPAIAEALDALVADVAEKERAIERFKSDIAVFKNSLAYFPTIIDEVGGGTAAWWVDAPALAESVHRLFRAVLAYAQPGGLASRDEVAAMVVRLEVDRAGAPEAVRPLLTNALRHARVIVERKGRIEALVNGVLQVPTADHGRRLLAAHAERFDRRLRAADSYRRLLFAGSVALVLLIAYALLRLRQSTSAMQTLNRELSREVSVRRMVEAEQRRLARAVEASPDGVVITDPDGTIVYTNPAFSEITGWAAEEAQGRNPRILRSGQVGEEVYRGLWAAIGRGEVWKGRFLNRRRGEKGDAGLFWAQTTIAPIYSEDASLDGFVAVQVDITEEVRREELAELERAATDLQAAVGRTLQEMRPLAERLDEALLALHGVERLGLHGSAELHLDAEMVESLAKGLEGADRFRVEVELEPRADEVAVAGEGDDPFYLLPLNHAGRSIGHLRLPLKGEADRSLTALELLRRVGESIGLALANERVRVDMERARHAAEAASRLKSDFLATMSHEIRTPMNAIIGMGELLLESPLNDEQRQYITTLRGAGETLLYIIDDILDLSRVEAGRMSLVAKPFFLGEVVGHICGMMEGQARAKGLELSCELPEGEGPQALLGDPGRLQQVLFNLVGNAVKFTDEGRVALRVAAKGEVKGRLEYQFQVEDTGGGIPPEMREAIFDRFTQVDGSSTRRHGGTGLGLAISSRLVELMGGRIWLESEEGEGSTFLFTARFPRADELPGRPAAPRELPTAVEPARHARLLLVEDSADNRTLILQYLKRLPFEVECAENGLEAVERVRDHHFDLVLMDMQMPVMDGYSATREIRRWEREGHHLPTRIVALTAHALVGDDEKSREAGCDDHLTKPIKKQTLLDALERHINVAE